MTKANITTGANITRKQMIELLNEDLAGEYHVVIAYTAYDPPEPQTFEAESDRTI